MKSRLPQTPEELRATNSIHPAFAAAIKARPIIRPSADEDLLVRRESRAKTLQRLRHLYPIAGPIPEVHEELQHIPARDGYQIPVKVYRPAKPSTEAGPLILMFHEGGWSMGDLTDEDFNCRMFARDLGAVCLNVDYRMAPEHLFSQWINDSWDVVQYAARHASSLNANPAQKGFIVGGASAGGNIASILAHLSVSENLQPPLTGQYLCVPYLLPIELVPEKFKDVYISATENMQDPVIGKMDPDNLSGFTTRLGVDIPSPLWSPFSPHLYPPTQQDPATENLPLAKAYMQVAGMDPLRDHALIYDQVLRDEYGVESKVDLYPGYGHMFWTNYPEMEESGKFIEDTLRGFKWLLGEAQ